mgnify:CR=1 FL=1|jgi:hypothetical protein
MERLKIYKGKKGIANFLIVFGGIYIIFGLGLVINSAMNKANVEWTSIIFTLQGILFVFWGNNILRSGKYFIEWNDVQMNYLLPNTKSIETFVYSQVKGVQIDLFEIKVDLGESKKVINLENMEFEHIKSLKQKFEEIRTTSEQNQP